MMMEMINQVPRLMKDGSNRDIDEADDDIEQLSFQLANEGTLYYESSMNNEDLIQNEARECRVCSDRSDGAHFGIDSCRACAAFFRRSVVMSKNYVCRQGGNNCVINKSVRCMCRKCRMRKCLEAGMLPENVQNRRDPIIPRRPNDLSSAHSGSSSSSEIGGVPSPDNEALKASVFHAVGSQNIGFSPFTTGLKSPSEEPIFLQKISNAYKNLCAIRRGIEISMSPSPLRGMFSDELSSAHFVPATTKMTSQLYRKHLPSISDFVLNTFDEFKCLKEEDKWSIFQSFLANLWTLDGSYRTYKLINPKEHGKKYMITETTYIDTDNLELFLADAPTNKMAKPNLVSMMRQCMKTSKLRSLTYMRDMQIQPEELAALIGLILWNPNIPKATEEMNAFAKECRTKIFYQLHLLYRYNNMDNYSERMGDLMCLFTCVLHQTTKMREDMELLNIFDVFAEDSFFYNMLKQ